jgi:hypothetical protein
MPHGADDSSPVLISSPKSASTFKPRTPKEREIRARLIELDNAYLEIERCLKSVGEPILRTSYFVATATYFAARMRLMMELPEFVVDQEFERSLDQLLGWRRLAANAWETSGEYWFQFDSSGGRAHLRGVVYVRNIVDMLLANTRVLAEATEDDVLARSEEVQAHVLEFVRLDCGALFPEMLEEARGAQSTLELLTIRQLIAKAAPPQTTVESADVDGPPAQVATAPKPSSPRYHPENAEVPMKFRTGEGTESRPNGPIEGSQADCAFAFGLEPPTAESLQGAARSGRLFVIQLTREKVQCFPAQWGMQSGMQILHAAQQRMDEKLATKKSGKLKPNSGKLRRTRGKSRQK